MPNDLSGQLAVVPILVGPLQVLLAMLPAILLGFGSALLALFKPATFKLGLRLLWRLKVSVIAMAVVLAGSVFAARSLRQHSQRAPGKAETSAHDWPIFRGGPRRTGAVAGSAGPAAGGVNWLFASEAKTFHASPAIVGKRVYVTSAEVGVFSTRGAIYCLDADTGAVVWKNAPDGFRATFSSPSVSGKYLVTGEGLHQTQDGRISCLDVTRGGALLWSYRTKSHVESSAAIADGRAFIGAGDDGVYCFALEPDAHGNPVMLWHLDGEKYPDAESAPVVHEGRVYFGLGLSGQAVVCVDAATGAERWRVRTPFPVFGPPALAHGKVFVGMGHGNFVESAEQIIARQSESLRADGKSEALIAEMARTMPLHGEVWCIDAATRAVEWRFRIGRTVLGGVAAGDDRVFFADRGGTVYSVGLHGKELARWDARAPILASPALAGIHLYVVAESGRLFALEQGTLQPEWETSLGAGGTYLSSPSVAHGRVYVGSPDRGVLCVGQPGGEDDAKIWLGDLGGPGRGGNVDGSPLPASGAIHWQWPSTDPGNATVITAPAAKVGKRLFVAVAEGSRQGVVCLRADAQSSAPVEEWFYHTPGGHVSSLAATARRVALVQMSSEGKDRELHILDAATGNLIWGKGSPAATEFLTLTRAALLGEIQPGTLTSFDLEGRTRWEEWLGVPSRLNEAAAGGLRAQLGGPVAVAHGIVFATTPEALLALDELEGHTLWKTALEEPPRTGPVVHAKTVLFGTASGISAHRVIDGARSWQGAVGSVKSALVLAGDAVCAVNVNGELVVLDVRSGEIRTRLRGATPDLPLLRARDALLYSGAEGLMRFDLAKQTAELWMSIAELGAITSPLILADSVVYFGTAKGGLICAGEPRP